MFSLDLLGGECILDSEAVALEVGSYNVTRAGHIDHLLAPFHGREGGVRGA